jgi:hypothetical protein
LLNEKKRDITQEKQKMVHIENINNCFAILVALRHRQRKTADKKHYKTLKIR